jgi:hypothetical protein
MTHTVADETETSRPHALGEDTAPGGAETGGAGTSAGSADRPVCVGHWILRFPPGKTSTAVRAIYENQVDMFNSVLTAYFDTTKYLSNGDRQQIRERFLPELKLINAYQAWDAVFGCFIGAVVSLLVIPLWLVCAAAASALAWDSAPLTFKLVYLLIVVSFLVGVFATYLRGGSFITLNHRARTPVCAEPGRQSVTFELGRLSAISVYVRLVGLFSAAASGWLLFGTWAVLDPLEASGVLLFSIMGAVIAMAAALFLLIIVESSTGRLRMGTTAVYLAAVGALIFAVTADHPDWPSWLVNGTLSALWASLILFVALGFLCLFYYLPQVGLWHWRNRQYVVAELVQTLTWLGFRLEHSDQPQSECPDPRHEASMRSLLERSGSSLLGRHRLRRLRRSELTLIDLPGLSLLEDLEYVAGLIQNYLPRRLRTLDPAGDSRAAERCRGMAAAVRQLKLDIVLNQNTSGSAVAGRVVPRIVPIILRDWEKVACIEPQKGLAPSGLKHTARGISKIIIAVAPLAALLALQYSGMIFSSIFTQLLGIAVTWLIVSILTWIDPRTESNISSLGGLVNLFPHQ